MILKVLIVEDEEIIRKGLMYTIDWIGMSCTVVAGASNGKDGLAMIKEHKPHIVLADINMPYMDGLSMVEKAKEFHEFHSIFLTSFSEFSYAQKAIELKASRYMLKPVNEDELKSIVLEIGGELKKEDYYKKLESINEKGIISRLEAWEQSNPYVDLAVSEIINNYSKKISINNIADKLAVSSSYLSRKFKECLSYSFLEVLNMYRIHQSLLLLKEGKLRIYEISELTGFSDYKHFCQVFKKYTGHIPSKF